MVILNGCKHTIFVDQLFNHYKLRFPFKAHRDHFRTLVIYWLSLLMFIISVSGGSNFSQIGGGKIIVCWKMIFVALCNSNFFLQNGLISNSFRRGHDNCKYDDPCAPHEALARSAAHADLHPTEANCDWPNYSHGLKRSNSLVPSR
jgi:hypothetical protein